MNYVIDFIDSLTVEEINNYCNQNNLTIVKQFDAFGNVFLCSALTEPATGPLVQSVVLNNGNTLDLLSVDIDLSMPKNTINIEVEHPDNWWKVATIKHVDFTKETFEHVLYGNNCAVYVVDSGIEADHPEFVGKDIQLLHSVTEDFTDTNGHGTAIASVITGNTCAIADTTVKVVKIFDQNVATTLGDLLDAFNSILTDFENSNRDTSIVNLSWAVERNDYLNAKIQTMIDRGLLVLAASGNNSSPIHNVTPACIPDVFTVGSYGQNLTPSSFSNYTDPSTISYTEGENNYGELDGWAPGEQIKSAALGGTYGLAAGTSMATAIASSTLAYNMSIYLGVEREYKDDMARTYQQGDRINELKSFTFQRDNLLQLEGEYANSTGKIATVISTPRIKDPTNIYYVRAGIPYVSLYAHPLIYSNMSTTDTLPANVSFSSSGYITINSSEIDTLYEEWPEFTMQVTDKNGVVINNTVKIVVYTQDKTYAQLVEDEMSKEHSELLDIILLYTCAGSATGCVGNCAGGPKGTGCFDIGFKNCDCIF